MIMSAVVPRPMVKRRLDWAAVSLTPMALRTCDGSSSLALQAEPAAAMIPASSSWMSRRSLSRPGTVIVCDNVIRQGSVIDDEHPDGRVQGIRRMFEQLKRDPRVDATALQTVGSKSYDGFVIAVVNQLDTIAS